MPTACAAILWYRLEAQSRALTSGSNHWGQVRHPTSSGAGGQATGENGVFNLSEGWCFMHLCRPDPVLPVWAIRLYAFIQACSPIHDPQYDLTPQYDLFHRITRSARAETDSGIRTPVVLADFRFTTSSNSVGCSIGRS